MSEYIPQPTPGALDIAEGMATEKNSKLAETFSRFSLAGEESIDVLLTPFIGGQRERYLITTQIGDRELYEKFQDALIPQFPREEVAGGTIYKLPLDIKPLDEERLFVDKVSSETYISDHELFFQLGELWAQIYKIGDKSPESDPLSHTSLLDWQAEGGKLIPIPPYVDWVDIPSVHEAVNYFAISLEDQLKSLNSQKSYKELIKAAQAGWWNASRE